MEWWSKMIDWLLVLQALSLLKTQLWESFRLLLDVPICLFWSLLGLIGRKPSTCGKCDFYEGTVWHCRRAPKENKFKYEVRMAVVDLDSPPSWWKSQAKYHWSAREARDLASTDGAVKLLCTPVSCGYIQNPLCVYYCYAQSGRLEKCIGEVTNTPWGERVSFLFDHKGQSVPKALHVSPFMDMKNCWTLKSSEPSSHLAVSVHVSHPVHGKYFDAVLSLKRCDSNTQRSEQDGFSTLWRYGFQPQRNALRIYWQAVKLFWIGVPFFGPPHKAYKAEVNAKATNEALPNGDKFLWKESTSFPFAQE